MADVIKGEMIRGQIDTVILLALTDGDKDSNDIRIAIEEKSDNQYSIKQGTFYSAMQRLVKQGLIKEYRSSALDGIRRKYYSLTPKGTKYLDKNREQWSISKALVDNLIDAEPTQVEIKPEKPAVEIVDEFDSFKALVEKSSEDFTLNTNDTDESYFDVLGASVLSDLNAELEKAEAENETNNSPTTTPQIEDEKPLNVQVEDEKLDIIEEKSSDFIDDYLSLSNKTKEELFSFELDDEEDAFALQEDIDQVEQEDFNVVEEDFQAQDSTIDQNSETLVEESTTEENIIVKDSIQQNENVVEETSNEEDDLLVIEEYTSSNRNKYKQILNSILPKTERQEIQVKEEKSDFEQVNIDSYENQQTNSYQEEQEKRALILEQMRNENLEKVTEEKQERVERKQINSDPSDFSDLYAMANREGFKIRTSHNTNKYVGNGILINKLRAHSSFVFFILLFVEALILNFALSSILEWKNPVKLIILGCLAIYPLITLFMYLLSPKRLVDEVSQFKDAMGVALIITFQMTIIILCVALFASVDFNNFKEVSSFILLPFILALNIPIYFILKYSLLSTGKYFTE